MDAVTFWTLAELLLSVMLTIGKPASPYSAVPLELETECHTIYTPSCRAETEVEALDRWRVIAQAIAEVSGERTRLAALLLAVTFHESGWRRDAHSGIGAWARGDQGRSWSLGQHLLGARGETWRGWTGAEIVGVDLVRTRRAIVTTADVLTWARERCDDAIPCTIAAYGGVRSSRDVRVRVRVATYERVLRLLGDHQNPNDSVPAPMVSPGLEITQARSP